MPYKANAERRHKIPKMRYRVTNWPDYDAALVRRGSLTLWVTEEALAAWHAPVTGKRGGQAVYSDVAIETGLALRLVFHQPLRQTEGSMRSIVGLLGLDLPIPDPGKDPGGEFRRVGARLARALPIPDHTTFSRRSGGLTVLPQRVARHEPLHLLIDSTGVKIYGEGEWLDQKHGVRSRRRWRKLHLAVDADTQAIPAIELTSDDVGDVSALPDLLDQIDSPVGSVTADGAYDGETVCDEVLHRHPAARVIIPPRSTAVLSKAGTTQRDDHLRSIQKHGRIGWQRRSGYGRRSLVETAMYRYKTIIGRRLQARTLPNQKTEAKIACNALNKMTRLGMPISVRIK